MQFCTVKKNFASNEIFNVLICAGIKSYEITDPC